MMILIILLSYVTAILRFLMTKQQMTLLVKILLTLFNNKKSISLVLHCDKTRRTVENTREM